MDSRGGMSAEFHGMICSNSKQPKEVNGDLYDCNATGVRLCSFLRKRGQDERQLLSSPNTFEPEHCLGYINQGAMLASVSIQMKKGLWSS